MWLTKRNSDLLKTGWEDFFDYDFFPFSKDFLPNTCPKVDLTNGEKEYSIQVEIPGMNIENINIEITGDVLTISGNKEEEKTEAYYKEIKRGSFIRQILLPKNVDTNSENIKATYKNGLLNITLLKTTQDSAKSSIKIIAE